MSVQSSSNKTNFKVTLLQQNSTYPGLRERVKPIRFDFKPASRLQWTSRSWLPSLASPESDPRFDSGFIRVRYAFADCRIASKMHWLHSLPRWRISYLAELREKWPATVWEMLINFLKYPILQWRGRWKSYPESVSLTGLPHSFHRYSPIKTPRFSIKPADIHTHKTGLKCIPQLGWRR